MANANVDVVYEIMQIILMTLLMKKYVSILKQVEMFEL